MLSNITFIQGSGGLGRPLAGQDHYSGLIFYSATLPSGFSASNRVKKFFSVTDAESAGINLAYTDETKATATYLVSAAGNTGDTIGFNVTEPGSKTVALGTFTKTAGQTTVNAVAAGIAAAINANTQTTGYSATALVATVTITARAGLGIYLNSGSPLVVQSPGAIAGTLTQFAGGAASRNAVYHYHISEFFRIQPKGVLWVGIFAVPSAYTFSEIATLQSIADGSLRQVGIYKDAAAFATADLTAIDLACKAQDTGHKPLIALYGADLSGMADISALTDLSLLSASTASAIIAQDGGAVGAALYQTFGKSITTLGAQLGATALAKVNEDIAWVQKFNISNGTECETLAFANGVLFSDPSVTDNLLNYLDAQRYVFLRKYVGYSGSFFNSFNMAVSVSSDYAYGEDNRTIQKAKRGIYASLLLVLNGPLVLNADGTLSANTLAYLETMTTPNLDQMVRDGEISAYQPVIDSAQNVSSTGTLVITVQIVADGVARQIQVPISYVQSLS
ncbi:DUF2586 family protein [Mucilaginibacter paludis]|uniref:Uncharacterized protein n=1 Tax=Mucilaginibacter paludis DSM 18603 TaxID=714943 RepID=H1YAZ0_9SPHI|nr:DUF2586 family protein [Mucilaginibacter paludis]EHQ30023.1 hypothetical protein Mucpa_5963 [Mucilaginibacter paludis DSM 18603]